MKKIFKYFCPHNWFKKREIVFYGAYPFVDKINPIIKSIDFKREWVKKAQLDFNKKILEKNQTHITSGHRCLGIQHLFKQGFILKSEEEFAIETSKNDDDIKIHTNNGICAANTELGLPTSIEPFSFFPKELLSEYTCPKGANKNIIKMKLPWFIDSPEDVIFLSIPIYYGDDNRFMSTPAILDPLNTNDVNIIFWWFIENSYEVIRKGTPFVQLIPIKRNSVCDNWKMIDRIPDKIYDKKFALNKILSL
jgi:hypothetical protein